MVTIGSLHHKIHLSLEMTNKFIRSIHIDNLTGATCRDF